MKSFIVLSVAALFYVALINAQTDEPTTKEPTTVPSTTPNPGVEYGGFCNGLLRRCNTHGNTVACIFKSKNETTGTDQCEQGLTVDAGRCQCQRNCKTAENGSPYEETGEYDKDKQKCVGLVGKTCSLLIPDCTPHATCNGQVCACQNGYKPDPINGLRCVGV